MGKAGDEEMTEQERREKVHLGLICCMSGTKDCEKCPYEEYGICYVQLRDDALYLLKAQEPRVMSKKEVRDWVNAGSTQRDPIYLEYKDPQVSNGWYIDGLLNFGIEALVGAGYLRCWTSRQTDAQREATPWQ